MGEEFPTEATLSTKPSYWNKVQVIHYEMHVQMHVDTISKVIYDSHSINLNNSNTSEVRNDVKVKGRVKNGWKSNESYRKDTVMHEN